MKLVSGEESGTATSRLLRIRDGEGLDVPMGEQYAELKQT